MSYPRRPQRRLPPEPFKQLKKLPIGCYVAIALAVLIGSVAYKGLVIVPQGEFAVLIRKTGTDLDPENIIATDPSSKGVQLETLGEGIHFLNPYSWDVELHEITKIPPGQMGIVTRLYGTPLPENQIVADEDGQMGIVREPLRPGDYRINPYAQKVTMRPAYNVSPGFLGVVCNQSGPFAKNPNAFVVERGERGVQRQTLSEGTHYINPYVEHVIPVNIRAHKFEIVGTEQISFVSKDGFTITVTGTVLWQIVNPNIRLPEGVDLPDDKRNQVAEVFVKYVDSRDVITCIVEKVILPNARSLCRIEGAKRLARDFIEGETREEFQTRFFEGMREKCLAEGILVHSVNIAGTEIPENIRAPIQRAEEAQQKRLMFEQQQEREIQEKILAEKREKGPREKQLVDIAAQVAVSLTLAEQEMQVAITEAEQRLEVAKRQYEAAVFQAEAIIAKGRADSTVMMLQNLAEARELEVAADAFGGGEPYSRYRFLEKLAPSLDSILSNTDGPFADLFGEMARRQEPANFVEPVPAGSPGNPPSALPESTQPGAEEQE